jgi:hypothetical protein
MHMKRVDVIVKGKKETTAYFYIGNASHTT